MRGKTKIGTTGLILSMLLSIIFAFPVSAATIPVNTLAVPTIVNPLYAPGSTFSFDLTLANMTKWWGMDFDLVYNPAVLTPTNVIKNLAAPVRILNEAHTIDPINGVLHIHMDKGTAVISKQLIGRGNGLKTAFKTGSSPIVPGTDTAYLDGVLTTAYTIDYVTGTITFATAPGFVARLNQSIGIGDGNSKEFGSLPEWPWVVDSETVYLYFNNTETTLTRGVDYIVDTNLEQLNFTAAPPKDYEITADYTTGVPVRASYTYWPGLTDGFANLLALITWTVNSRGTSPLTLQNVVLKDVYMNTVTPVNLKSGSFDNRLQGTMSVTPSQIIDFNLVNVGDMFDVYVQVGPWNDHPLEKLWGFQFVMSYDPNVVMAVDYETFGIFTPGPTDLGADYAAISGNSYYGDPVGLTTNVPVVVARIGFVVLAQGVTALTLHDTAMADVGGNALVHEVTGNGWFANTQNLSISVNTMFVESRKWSASKDGGSFALTAQVTNTNIGITKAFGHFVVYDSLGAVVADLTTPGMTVLPGTTARLTTTLNVGQLAAPESYVVECTVLYWNYLGNMVAGKKGSPTGARSTMVKTFTLYP